VVPLGGLFKINEITMDLEKGSCDNEVAFLQMLSPSSRQRREDRMTRQWLARFSFELLIAVAAGSERQHIQRIASPPSSIVQAL
jgi:hypothetical protein